LAEEICSTRGDLGKSFFGGYGCCLPGDSCIYGLFSLFIYFISNKNKQTTKNKNKNKMINKL